MKSAISTLIFLGLTIHFGTLWAGSEVDKSPRDLIIEKDHERLSILANDTKQKIDEQTRITATGDEIVEALPGAACDPTPIPLDPVGPTQSGESSEWDEEFFWTIWRYPCNEDFSWVIFTLEPKVEGAFPFICSIDLTLIQEGVEDSSLSICSNPYENYCDSKCGDVFTKSSYALTKYSHTSDGDKINDLNRAFQLYWDLNPDPILLDVPAYDPAAYGYEPRMDNQMAVNGVYYDPNNSGHGFDFKLSEYGLTIYYYGHTSSGERLWLISGLYREDVEIGVPFTRNMKELVNGVFNDPSPPTTVWGTITVTFTDCDSGTIVLDGIDGFFEMNFTRLAGLKNTECSRFSTNLE